MRCECPRRLRRWTAASMKRMDWSDSWRQVPRSPVHDDWQGLGRQAEGWGDAAQVISRVCREANIDLTLVQVTRKRFWTRLSQRKQSQRMSLRRVSQVSRYCQRKQWLRRTKRRRWLSRSLLLQMMQQRKAHHNMVSLWMHSQRFWIISESERRRRSSYHIMASVLVRSRRFWSNSPERELTNTATVQEDAPVSEQWRLRWKSLWIERRLLKGR